MRVQYRELELRRDFNLSKVMTVGEPRRSDANKMKVKCQSEGAEKRAEGASTNNLDLGISLMARLPGKFKSAVETVT